MSCVRQHDGTQQQYETNDVTCWTTLHYIVHSFISKMLRALTAEHSNELITFVNASLEPSYKPI